MILYTIQLSAERSGSEIRESHGGKYLVPATRRKMLHRDVTVLVRGACTRAMTRRREKTRRDAGSYGSDRRNLRPEMYARMAEGRTMPSRVYQILSSFREKERVVYPGINKGS